MKFFLPIILTLITLATRIPASGQVEFNFFAGPQITTTRYTIQNVHQNADMKYGFQAGLALKVPFENKLFFSPTAFYSLKGYKVKFNQFSFPPDSNATDNNTSIHTFEIATLLQFDFNDRPDHFFFKAGPSFDFQVSGKEKFNVKSGDYINRNMKFSFGDYGFVSANILTQFGFETKNGLIVFAQYSYGLASINNADGGPQICHRVFGISIGKYLKRKKIVINTENKE